MKIQGLFLSLVALPSFALAQVGYAPASNDAYWPEMWHLENRDSNGVRRASTAVDMNAREAWSITRGAGVNIAIVDDGVELAHPDLANRALPGAHYNFETDTANGGHPLSRFFHGTGVAGMAVAEGNNQRGIIGIAPESRFASWVIFRTNAPSGAPYVSTAQRAKMFQYLNDTVAIQNHSWVSPGAALVQISLEENAAISNAVTLGRGGKGVVMVRAAGNMRLTPRNVNEDQYLSDPRAITVAAVRSDGRATSYSTPGAAILVSAPSGDEGSPRPFSTDRLGTAGYNQIMFQTDHADYVFGGLWTGGTSTAAPLVSGVAALMLSANPSLTYRDVQQILLLASAQSDPADPDVTANGAGLLVSHNTGFGLVNAGTAVELARNWKARPPLSVSSWESAVSDPVEIPDAGVRVRLVGPSFPAGAALVALPSLGIVPDGPTATLPLVYVGLGFNITEDLSGKGALIRRGGGDFADKLNNAARAGAAFAIMFNNQGTNDLQAMGNTDFVPIPSVFISQADGENLARFATNETVQAQLLVRGAQIGIEVDQSLLCEQVSLELAYEHEQRGDVRVTLLSPMGTRSVLQRLGDVTNRFSGTWTFTSTHHFYESAKGMWRVEVSDQVSGGSGTVSHAKLTIRGVPIEDSDSDALDDNWETQSFGSLERGPKDDPDADGFSNAREQIVGTSPVTNDSPLQLAISADRGVARLAWASRAGVQYEVQAATNPTQPFVTIATVLGESPRTAWFGRTDPQFRFFRVRERP